MRTSTRAARRAIAAAAILGAAALVAACGSSGPPSSQRTVTVTTTPTAPASSSAAAQPSSPGASTPAGPPGCLTSALQVKLGVAQGTAGTIYQVVDLTNISSSTCSLYGYPGVSFVSGIGGSQIGHPATRNPVTAARRVTLAPGQVGNFLLAVTDAGAVCKPVTVHWLKIYPPGETAALYLSYTTQACPSASVSTMKTSVVTAGAGSAS